MGKKMKKKGPNPLKSQQRGSVGSPKSVLEGSSPNIGSVGCGDRDEEACNHRTQSTSEMNLILLKIRSASMDAVACEYCREGPVSKRGGKEKGKQSKKKGPGTRASEAKSDQMFYWVCLDCGQYFCGGEVSVSEPYGHARRHAKQQRHQWAVRVDNPLVSWCYSCCSSVPIQLPVEIITEESKDAMTLRGNAVEHLDPDKFKGHKVRGLSNLGNTCFFNSVMQNLFAMDLLRDSLLALNRPVGPLFLALKILFTETSRSAESKGVVNPKALFGCICAKAPQFRGYQQQDSHELLCYLLDGLQTEETNARKASELANNPGELNVEKEATLIDSIFGGRLSSTVSCMECGHTSVVNEPFLDLSLPVPSKKPPSKKLPPPPSKRVNQRDKNKARRFRERAITQASSMSVSQKEELEQPSECCESGIDVPERTNDNVYEAEEFTWMDYLGSESQNCDDFGAQEEASLIQSSLSKQENETKGCVQTVSELHNETESSTHSVSQFHTSSCCNNFTPYFETSAERSCKDETPHSCVPVPGVILLPYIEKANYEANPIDASVSESSVVNSTCKHVEEVFDGFGELFNEPEVTSDLREDTSVGEDMDITLWNGNISESNLEEVDDTNAPVSIYSCLALFTKPELLSDEQAWYCERCSERLPQVNRELRTNRLQATTKVSDQPVTVKSMVNGDEFRSKRFASNSHWDSSIVDALDNGKLASSSKIFTTQSEGHFDRSTLADGSHSSGESNSNETLHLSETTPCSNMIRLLDVLDKEMLDTDTSLYFPIPTAANNVTHDCSNDQESNFNCINERNSGGTDGNELTDSHSLNSHTNVAPQNSSKERSQEVSQVKKGLKSSKGHPSKENKGEGSKMVRRDATKRILIDRVPPILTIHLKRFSQDGRGRLSKLSGHVSFQETLDMRPYMNPRCIKDRSTYRLLGVVEHSGSMSGGHYVAYMRGDGRGNKAATGSSSTGNAWFYASDAYVREVSSAEVLQSEAYILFYEKI